MNLECVFYWKFIRFQLKTHTHTLVLLYFMYSARRFLFFCVCAHVTIDNYNTCLRFRLLVRMSYICIYIEHHINKSMLDRRSNEINAKKNRFWNQKKRFRFTSDRVHNKKRTKVFPIWRENLIQFSFFMICKIRSKERRIHSNMLNLRKRIYRLNFRLLMRVRLRANAWNQKNVSKNCNSIHCDRLWFVLMAQQSNGLDNWLKPNQSSAVLRALLTHFMQWKMCRRETWRTCTCESKLN